MPSRIASSPRFIPPYDPEIPIFSFLPFASIRASHRLQGWPGELDSRAHQQRLESVEQARLVADRSRRELALDAERRQKAGHLADIPLHRVDAKGPVGDVRHPEVLPAGEQVLDADRDHRSERDLEGPASEIEVGRAAG